MSALSESVSHPQPFYCSTGPQASVQPGARPDMHAFQLLDRNEARQSLPVGPYVLHGPPPDALVEVFCAPKVVANGAELQQRQ